MTNTYTICPTDELAKKAFPLVRQEAQNGEIFTAVRGCDFGGDEEVYAVCSVPYIERQGYIWNYFDPAEWCGEFERSQFPILQ